MGWKPWLMKLHFLDSNCTNLLIFNSLRLERVKIFYFYDISDRNRSMKVPCLSIFTWIHLALLITRLLLNWLHKDFFVSVCDNKWCYVVKNSSEQIGKSSVQGHVVGRKIRFLGRSGKFYSGLMSTIKFILIRIFVLPIIVKRSWSIDFLDLSNIGTSNCTTHNPYRTSQHLAFVRFVRLVHFKQKMFNNSSNFKVLNAFLTNVAVD